MSAQVGPNCYATAEQAARAAASAEVGKVVAAGSAVYVVDATAASGSSITYTLTPLTGGAPLTLAAPFTAQPCGLLDWSDSLTIGWGIAAVWIAAAALMMLRKGVHA